MAQPGLRLLSLDGGGTRGLSTLYMLREIMGNVVSGNGGDVRPCEYFDLIGASGLSGLCALLFVRFCYTIDDAIKFLYELSQDLDDVESFRLRVLRGEANDLESWEKCLHEFKEPLDQLGALRQGIVQDSWEAVIKKNITDGLEVYPHMENGEFNFKNPSVIVEAGRPKAFVVGSESQGYGDDGGFDDTRKYNVPILHRTYDCRHGKSLYTFYAVGLATVASPDIMKPGVIFPDFLATGRHTIHNPTRLMLEESTILWPGLRVGLLVSIGTGAFELDNSLLNSISSETATACLQIFRKNHLIAEDIRRFVLPHDKNLDSAYFRFDISAPSPFHEFSARKIIEAEVRSRLGSDREATKCARAVDILRKDNFPTSPEDLVALASLASLLHELVLGAYTTEATIIADSISNFLLYEAASGEDGSFRKVSTANRAEGLASLLRHMNQAYEDGYDGVLQPDLRSEGAILTDLMAFGDDGSEKRAPGELETVSDYAAGAYYFLIVLRRNDSLEKEAPRFEMLLRQLSALMGTLPEITQQTAAQVGSLLELATLAALCQAGAVQALRGYKGLSYNGSLIGRVHSVLQSTSVTGVSQSILGPIANMLAISIKMNNWSLFRDDAIITLLNSGSTKASDNWSLVNLALERYRMDDCSYSNTGTEPNILSICENFLESHARAWSAKASEMLTVSIKSGYFGLAWKCVRGENLTTATQISSQYNFESNGETALHQAAKSGFPYVMKNIVEALGMDYSRDIVNLRNREGQTPLHLACRYRAPKEIFRLLLILGANVNIQCRLGRTALHYCFPMQNTRPSVEDAVMLIIQDKSLPTIIPHNSPKAYGIHGKGKSIDSRVWGCRVIIDHLLCRRADMSILDDEGQTPLHLAAKHGWGDNIDIFFLTDQSDSERQQRSCLRIRDNSGLTILDHARATGVKGALNGREDIIASEMRKRSMEIPPRTAADQMALEPQVMKMTIGKRISPIPDRGPEPSYEPPASYATQSSNIPPTTAASSQLPPRFAPLQVYHDPEVEGGRSPSETSYEPRTSPNPRNTTATSWSSPTLTNASSDSHFPPSQVYHDPEIISHAPPRLPDELRRKPIPQVAASPRSPPQPPGNYPIVGQQVSQSTMSNMRPLAGPPINYSSPSPQASQKTPPNVKPSPGPAESKPKSSFFKKLSKGK